MGSDVLKEARRRLCHEDFSDVDASLSSIFFKEAEKEEKDNSG